MPLAQLSPRRSHVTGRATPYGYFVSPVGARAMSCSFGVLAASESLDGVAALASATGRALVSGTTAPVFDPAVVGPETVVSAPQHRLGAVGDTDLAVGRSDVGLDGVDAQKHQLGELRVGLALRDQSEDFGLSVGQAFDAAGPVTSRISPRSRWGITDHCLTRRGSPPTRLPVRGWAASWRDIHLRLSPWHSR